MGLPEWIKNVDDGTGEFGISPYLVHQLQEALSIAWEALELIEKNCDNHSGIPELALDKIKRIGE